MLLQQSWQLHMLLACWRSTLRASLLLWPIISSEKRHVWLCTWCSRSSRVLTGTGVRLLRGNFVAPVKEVVHLRAGAAQTERQSISAAAAVDHMTREEAYAAMDMVQPLRAIMRDAVYGYWADKRKRTGKPFIRRLWAPTSSSDQNPFSVFR